MELRHLRYFVAVADELNFTKAAAKLHLAQPSLTRQIKDLEEELGVHLFDRSKQRISLTEAGRLFVADARRLLCDCAECVQALQRRSRGEIGQMKIGYVANVYYDLLPATLREFRKTCAHAELNLCDMTPAEQYLALAERRIDLGFVSVRAPGHDRGLAWACVSNDAVSVALPLDNALARKAKIDLRDLESMFFVGMAEKTSPGARDWLETTCRKAGYRPKILQEVDRESAALGFVAAGLGVALLPHQIQRLPHENVVFRPLRGNLTTDSYAVWRADNASTLLKQYVAIVKDFARENGVGVPNGAIVAQPSAARLGNVRVIV